MGVRREGTGRKADDGLEVEFLQERLLYLGERPAAEKRSLGHNHPAAGAVPGLELAHDVPEEEEFGGRGRHREVGLDVAALHPAEGRIGYDDIKALGDPADVLLQGVAAVDHVHQPQQGRDGLLLLVVESALLQGPVILDGPFLFLLR